MGEDEGGKLEEKLKIAHVKRLQKKHERKVDLSRDGVELCFQKPKPFERGQVDISNRHRHHARGQACRCFAPGMLIHLQAKSKKKHNENCVRKNKKSRKHSKHDLLRRGKKPTTFY